MEVNITVLNEISQPDSKRKKSSHLSHICNTNFLFLFSCLFEET